MKIRSITYFCNPASEDFKAKLATFVEMRQVLRSGFEELGWEIQTERLATTPFGSYTTVKTTVTRIKELEQIGADKGFTYLSAGPARINHPEEYELIPEILAATENVFCTGILSHHHRGISTAAARACAKVIVELASLTPDGFTNLNFCAMSRVQPFTPFFPAAYSYGTDPAFALAMECADAAIEAFDKAKDTRSGVRNLVEKLDKAAAELTPIARKAAIHFGIPFKGFDFSLAPFPEEWCSLGGAFERLGVSSIGKIGSLTAAAVLADALDRGSWLRAGFNGLMMPVLEDSNLAARTESPHFTIKDLLLYSTVCGTGLDTVPLPGDVSAEMVEALLLDISALSLRLNKPLTARLMPVPGLKSGDKTFFDFDFFKNGQIMDLPAQALTHALASSEWINIQQRKPLV